MIICQFRVLRFTEGLRQIDRDHAPNEKILRTHTNQSCQIQGDGPFLLFTAFGGEPFQIIIMLMKLNDTIIVNYPYLDLTDKF